MSITLDSLMTALRTRRLELRLTGNKLQVFDADNHHAWPALTPDEQAFIRTYRQELKTFLKTGLVFVTQPSESAQAPQPTTPEPQIEPPKPEIPEYIRRILEWNTPAERARRDAEATAVMYRMVGRTSPYL